jgi:hypothetical protein
VGQLGEFRRLRASLVAIGGITRDSAQRIGRGRFGGVGMVSVDVAAVEWGRVLTVL